VPMPADPQRLERKQPTHIVGQYPDAKKHRVREKEGRS
jgi:hypothetical protein